MKFNIYISLKFIRIDEDHDSPCLQPLFELPKDQPACLADIPRFYHDHASGECKQFSYDGCNKNANHFESKEECDKTCSAWHEAHKNHDHGKAHEHSGDCKHGKHDHDHHH